MKTDKQIDIQIGQVLREERTRRGYSMEYIAVKLGVNKSTISFWESGRNGMSAGALFKYCAVLNIAPSDVFRIVERR